MTTYNPVVPPEVERPETVPLLQPPTLAAIEAQDAAYAVRLNQEEISSLRLAEIEANSRAWDAHYRRPNPYYYGTWRGPQARPFVIYRDYEDPRAELYTFLCFFLWVSIFLYIITYLAYYY